MLNPEEYEPDSTEQPYDYDIPLPVSEVCERSWEQRELPL